MGFRLLIICTGPSETHLNQHQAEEWPRRLAKLVPDIQIDSCHSVEEAMDVIGEADAAFGEVIPELFQRAKRLQWVQSPRAAPKAGYYHPALIDSDVVVTNMRGIFSDHIGAHIMSFVLAFSRGLHVYLPQQLRREWKSGAPVVYLPEATAVIVGVGAIGSEVARLCSEFGMTVVGVDARTTEPPPGVSNLYTPDRLPEVLPRADFLIVTVPETPETRRMFAASVFRLMKPTAYLINIGRGATVVLDDLVEALRGGEIAGAGLDVYETEPLPADHLLWTTPGALMTPHMAADGPYVEERRAEVFMDNCVRFDEGRELRNIVDKAKWF
jgi:phosphoglycerate dehydrogenase-like enzyme